MPAPGWKAIGIAMPNMTLSAKCAAAWTASVSPFGNNDGVGARRSSTLAISAVSQ